MAPMGHVLFRMTKTMTTNFRPDVRQGTDCVVLGQRLSTILQPKVRGLHRELARWQQRVFDGRFFQDVRRCPDSRSHSRGAPACARVASRRLRATVLLEL